ncbi:MAG: FMN-binding protein [Erysipelotrichaceae bacterium]|nr:FMN-binding protein [Erysipelotrichaceae bacterium]MDP3305357.1 FMN-binding protein [Erysipelotrichaceae bacterium]
MKKRVKTLIVLVVFILVVSYVAYFAIERNLEGLEEVNISPVDLSLIKDGDYQGKYSAFPVSVMVEVSVVDHRITKIDIIKHNNGQGGDAEAIVDEVIRLQSLDVDVISGATYSSQVIKLAIADAFK